MQILKIILAEMVDVSMTVVWCCICTCCSLFLNVFKCSECWVDTQMDELDLLYSLWNKSSVEMCGKDYVFFQNRIPEM